MRANTVLGTNFDGAHARIYKTQDGGARWTMQYEAKRPGVFFDGMAFWDAQHGVAMGDPVDGSLMIVRTDDGGATWTEVPRASIPSPLDGEAAFAASGTGLTVQPGGHAWFGTGGGKAARVYHSSDFGRTWSVAETPLAGSESGGIFGVAFRDAQHGVAVGGDYKQPTSGASNILQTRDGGRTWRLVGASRPPGVRYGAVYTGGRVVAVGPTGSGYSIDDGMTWTAIDTVALNTVSFAPYGAGWAAGGGGRIVRWISRGRK